MLHHIHKDEEKCTFLGCQMVQCRLYQNKSSHGSVHCLIHLSTQNPANQSEGKEQRELLKQGLPC